MEKNSENIIKLFEQSSEVILKSKILSGKIEEAINLINFTLEN